MDIKTARDALITQFKNDTDLATEVSNNIDYGLGKKVLTAMLPKSIRVVQIGIGDPQNSDGEQEADFSGGHEWVFVPYRFHVVGIFKLSDGENEKSAEDRESTFNRLIRKAICKDRTLGGVANNTDIGRTFFRTHPEDDTVYFVLIEVTVWTYEKADTR